MTGAVARGPARFVLRGGTVVDGTGAQAARADVLVADGRIESVLSPGDAPAGVHTVDVDGRVVAPGFIDLHTHGDFSLPTYPRAPSMVRQGVTTVVVGNCGFSTAPVPEGERFDLFRRYTAFLGSELDYQWRTFPEFLAVLRTLPLVPNVAALVGHGTVRAAVVGYDDRPATDDEIERMRAIVAEAMDAGAYGVSTGLIYPPGTYAPTDEVVALTEVAAGRGGFYATHMRNEGPLVMDALAEAVAVAERAGSALQVSHHKVLGRPNWGLTERSLAFLEERRQRGLDVLCDQYPYEASSTNLAALLPGWVQAGGTTAMQERLRTADLRARVRAEVLDGPPDGPKTRDFEPDLVSIASVDARADSPLVGATLEEIARERAVEPVDAMLDLLAEHGGTIEVVAFSIGRDDLERVMRDPHVAIASDGWTLDPRQGGRPHPRSYGTFARVLGRFVRDDGVLTLPDAVRKMTSLPARRLGLVDRGRVAAGQRADVVVFDPETIVDRATFAEPHQFAGGVDHVVIAGVPVILAGDDTGESPGTVLERAS